MDVLAMLASLLASLFGNSSPTSTPAVLSQSESVYEARYFSVTKSQTLRLVSNYNDQKSTQDLIQVHSCKAGANGGFYSEQRSPIGWFVSNGTEINRSQKNQLFNGFLSRDVVGQTEISYSRPVKSVVSGMQSGPVLLYERKPVTLKLVHDKQARRVVAAINRQGDIFFITFFKSHSVLDGPSLSELPQLVVDFAQDHHQEFVTAINLDGGSASAFYTQAFQLDEWQPIGSWWCLSYVGTSQLHS